MTFKEVREMWWTGQLFDKRGVTIFRLSEVIRCHVTPYFDDKKLSDITDVEINKYIKEELEHGNRKLTNRYLPILL